MTKDRALELAVAELHESRRREANVDRIVGVTSRTGELSEVIKTLDKLREELRA